MSAGDGCLDRLAARAGIQSEYVDAWGERREVTAATRQALLATMGLPAQTEAEIRASLDRLLARARNLLAPTSVVRRGEAVAVVLCEPLPAGPLRWRVETEDGAQLSGEAAPGELPVDESFTVADKAYTRRRLACTGGLDWGYHHLRVEVAGHAGTAQLIVVPDRAWQPEAFAGEGRRWGLSVQLYALRSQRNWGIGDFTDLAVLVAGAAELGAAVVGINPLHAPFPQWPESASPYSPSSRLFLNPLYLDVEAIAEFATCAPARQYVNADDFQARVQALRDGRQVDYAAVAALKWPVLELLYEQFQAHAQADPSNPHLLRFQDFQHVHGRALRRFAAFNALAEDRQTPDWHAWPEAYRDPDSPAVDTFISHHGERVEFHEYVQWQAEQQFTAAAAAASEHGLEIGVYADLAVGADPHGAEAWSTQHTLASNAAVGAPPDVLNLSGQNWGLPPPVPLALQKQNYAPFSTLLRANMAHVSALRIDHILGLMRMYWIPEGAEPKDGAYVAYPFRDLVGLLALESHRNRCLVVGEDLGTVPLGLRETLDAAGILSYRLLYFEKTQAGFRPPAAYPANALVTVGTHDLPTLPAFWAGEDIELRTQLGLWPSPAERAAETETRERDRAALSAALHREGLAQDERPPGQAPIEAAYRYLACTPCKLLMLQTEDVMGQHEQVNVPGTVDEYPNWRQRQPLTVEEFLAAPPLARLAAALNETRGHPPDK